jgi:hypothetical protein
MAETVLTFNFAHSITSLFVLLLLGEVFYSVID